MQSVTKKIIVAISIVLVVVGYYGYSQYNRTMPSAQDTTAVLKLSVPEIQIKHKLLQGKFDVQFADKVFEITGTVSHIENASQDKLPMLYLDEYVKCELDKASTTLPKVGQTVTLKAYYVGYEDLFEEFIFTRGLLVLPL